MQPLRQGSGSEAAALGKDILVPNCPVRSRTGCEGKGTRGTDHVPAQEPGSWDGLHCFVPQLISRLRGPYTL